MTVTAEWVQRNLGLPSEQRTPLADETPVAPEDGSIRRQLIDFDSEGASGASFASRAPLAALGLTHYVPIPWPKNLEPKVGAEPAGESLPKSDVLIVTWTMDEGHALSQVMTPGVDSKSGWKPYVKNFDRIAKTMSPGCPAREANRLGTYWTNRIGTTKVTLFKSDSHMSQDGPALANAVVWKQIIDDCKPSWVITTGTGGGIGPTFEVGDVIVSRFVTFDCKREFKKLNGESFSCSSKTPDEKFRTAQSLFATNAAMLPKVNTRAPRIVSARSAATGILTTDFFGFDNTADTYGLEGKGDLSEMGDAVLGMVCKERGTDAPNYVIVRNVSDPQIDSKGLTLEQQTGLAGSIYMGYGLWSSICSAIVCWAIVAAL